MSERLGAFEQLLLFALLELEDEGHGVAIRRLLEERAGRVVSPGAVYTALERLRKRGLVTARVGDTTPARGGRRRKYYRIEAEGARALHRSFTALTEMARGLAPKLETLAADGRRGGDR